MQIVNDKAQFGLEQTDKYKINIRQNEELLQLV